MGTHRVVEHALNITSERPACIPALPTFTLLPMSVCCLEHVAEFTPVGFPIPLVERGCLVCVRALCRRVVGEFAPHAQGADASPGALLELLQRPRVPQAIVDEVVSEAHASVGRKSPNVFRALVGCAEPLGVTECELLGHGAPVGVFDQGHGVAEAPRRKARERDRGAGLTAR